MEHAFAQRGVLQVAHDREAHRVARVLTTERVGSTRFPRCNAVDDWLSVGRFVGKGRVDLHLDVTRGDCAPPGRNRIS